MLLTLMLGGAECFWPQAIILLSYCHIVNQSSHYMKISQVVEPTHHTRCLISAQWRKFFLLRSLFVPLFSALFETIASDDGARNPMRSRWLSRSFCFFFLGGGIPKFPQVSGLYIIHGLFSRKKRGMFMLIQVFTMLPEVEWVDWRKLTCRWQSNSQCWRCILQGGASVQNQICRDSSLQDTDLFRGWFVFSHTLRHKRTSVRCTVSRGSNRSSKCSSSWCGTPNHQHSLSS